MNVGIIGAGHIAEKAARTLAAMDDMSCIAIGSRTLEKAQDFAGRFSIPRAYGSYEELFADPDVDLVYVATPHSCHFANTRDAILAGKPCLVEKSFMMNAAEAAAILALSHEKNIFVAEAIWSRYLPVRDIVCSLLEEGAIGKSVMIMANMAFEVSGKERVVKPELGGGALLDLGVYLLNFVRMYTKGTIERINTTCIRSESGVDATENITMVLEDGTMASVQASAWCHGDNKAVISGSGGFLVLDDIVNPTCVQVYHPRRELVRTVKVPEQITGFEYQFRACKAAIEAGEIEPPQMPHAEILYIMHLMDRLRSEWGTL